MKNSRRLNQVGPITALTLIELFIEGDFKLTQEELDDLVGIVSACLERLNDAKSDEDDPI